MAAKVTPVNEFNFISGVEMFLKPGPWPSLLCLDSRVTLALFALTSLDLLDAMDRIQPRRQQILDWIYSLQISTADCGTVHDSVLG